MELADTDARACLNALESQKRRPLPSGVGPVFDDPEASRASRCRGSSRSPPTRRRRPSSEASSGWHSWPRCGCFRPVSGRRSSSLRGSRRARRGRRRAELLGTTTASVNNALQRAWARLRGEGVDPDAQPEPAAEQRAVVNRFIAAFERADVAELTELLADNVVLEMPPRWNWYRGTDDFSAFMRRVFRTRGEEWRTMPLWANGEAGFAGVLARRAPHRACPHRGRRKGDAHDRVPGRDGVRTLRGRPMNHRTLTGR